MEDYADLVALERTRRAQTTPPDQHPAISLTPDQHPVIMLPQREGQALPVTFDGGVDPPAPIVVPPVVTQMLPPQALEEGRVAAPARRDVLGNDARGEALRLWDAGRRISSGSGLICPCGSGSDQFPGVIVCLCSGEWCVLSLLCDHWCLILGPVPGFLALVPLSTFVLYVYRVLFNFVISAIVNVKV